MATVLGLESTCDETAAAVVADGCRVRSSVVASQVEIHAKYRGVVPEIASRAHIENVLPVVKEALSSAAVELRDIDAVAVTNRPGLIGSLLIGVTAAKTLAWALGRPLAGIDHVHAHLYSVALENPGFAWMPAVGMVLSGGHTSIYRVDGPLAVQLLGSTTDDAVGEAYDKVAAILGLGYPGGPIIDDLAQRGDPQAVRFPRTMLGRGSLDFSFSGIKTAVLYHVRGYQGRQHPDASHLSEQQIADIAASFQAACIDVITRKLQRALKKTRAKMAIIGGGVSANRGLRAALAQFQAPVVFPDLKYTTDNAAMSAGLADVKLRSGQTAGLDLDAVTYSQFQPA